jgi:hypothetical protein
VSTLERAELADIKRRWNELVDKLNDEKIPAVCVALWATLNVGRLIELAEAGQ